MKVCAFCGPTDSPITKEDVFPLWLTKLINQEFNPNKLAGVRTRLRRGDSERSKWRTWKLELATNDVCKTCNGGWMSDLETFAAPVLTPLIIGDTNPRMIDVDARVTIAIWILKTCMMLDIAEKAGPFFTAKDRQTFSDTLDPPSWAHVWIASYRGLQAAYWQARQHEFSRQFRKVQGNLITVLIGHLAFQFYGLRYIKKALALTPVEVSQWHSVTRKVWPSEQPAPDIDWPPPLVFEDNGFNEFIDRWATPYPIS